MNAPAPRQLSLFGVEARPPALRDLEGLLAGAGRVTRMGGTARVSVVVDEPWRAAALLRECALRGLAAAVTPLAAAGQVAMDQAAAGQVAVDQAAAGDVGTGQFEVRTAYAAALAPLGARWLQGRIKRPPDGFILDGRRLRLWAIAAGRPEGAHAYTLRLGPDDELMWQRSGAALAALGLPAVLLGSGAGGPAYRILGRRRLARLAELISDAPPAAPAGAWL